MILSILVKFNKHCPPFFSHAAYPRIRSSLGKDLLYGESTLTVKAATLLVMILLMAGEECAL